MKAKTPPQQEQVSDVQSQITPQFAQRLLNRDEVNRIKRVDKGGLLSVAEKQRLKRIAKQRQHDGQNAKIAGELNLKTFEGTFEQKRRRRKVYELRLRNYSIREIAAELGSSTGAIQGDLKAIDAALQKQIDPANATAIINEALADLEAVRLMAMEGLKEVEDGSHRNGYLNTIIDATKAKVALLQDAGTLPKAGRKVELTGKDGVPLPPASVVQPVVNVVFEQTEETREIAKRYNSGG